jgi:hypothetical protein
MFLILYESYLLLGGNNMSEEWRKYSGFSVRPDVEKIINQSDEDFTWWYDQRKSMAKQLLAMYSLVGTIPRLANSSGVTLRDYNEFRDHVDLLEEGLNDLETICRIREAAGYNPILKE